MFYDPYNMTGVVDLLQEYVPVNKFADIFLVVGRVLSWALNAVVPVLRTL